MGFMSAEDVIKSIKHAKDNGLEYSCSIYTDNNWDVKLTYKEDINDSLLKGLHFTVSKSCRQSDMRISIRLAPGSDWKTWGKDLLLNIRLGDNLNNIGIRLLPYIDPHDNTSTSIPIIIEQQVVNIIRLNYNLD